jgi:hypothetical protein
LGNRQRHVANLLAVAGVLWSIGVGVWIWLTPIRTSVVLFEASASSVSGSAVSATRTDPVQRTRRFADISLLGPVPLIIPAALAGLAALAVWRRKGALLMLAPTCMLAAFCFIAGFSIGFAYIPAGGLLVAAVAVSLFSN